MGMSILITGGARSGKSRIAEGWATRDGAAIYIATCRAKDSEMTERVAEHRARRGPEWKTLEEPIDLASALDSTDGQGTRLVDCLTLWLANLMEDGHDWHSAVEDLVRSLHRQASPVIIVSSEVGSGIVPESPLAREFRDALGLANQAIADAADEVYLAVAGHPLKVKPNAAG